MDCQSVREKLTDYLLGELELAEHDAVRAHLSGCTACAEDESRLRGLLTKVEAAVRSDEKAAGDFASRVMSRIPAHEFRTRPALRFSRAAAAMVTAAAVLGFAILLHPFTKPANPAQPIGLTSSQIMQFHEQAANGQFGLPRDERPPVIEAAYLSEQAGYHVLPVSVGEKGVAVSKIGVARMAGKPVAVWQLQKHGKAMTLMQFNQAMASLPKLTPMPFPHRMLLCGGAGNCHFAAWQEGGMTYILVADMPDQDIDSVALSIPSTA